MKNKHPLKAVFNKAKDVGEVYLYGVITDETFYGDEVTPAWVREELEKVKDAKKIKLYVNSPGGGVFAGMAIHNMIKRIDAEVTAYIDGAAASIASVIVQAADKIVMPENAMFMIHNPIAGVYGEAEDMRKTADTMDRIKETILVTYMDRVNKSREEVSALMDAETWLGGADAVDLGFADELAEPVKMAASASENEYFINGVGFSLNKFSNFPKKSFKNTAGPEKLKNFYNAKVKFLKHKYL